MQIKISHQIKRLLTFSIVGSTLLFQASVVQAQSQSILVLVNDEPVTAFDVKERTRLSLASSREAQSMLKAKFKSQRTRDRFKAFMQENRPTSREEANQLKNKFIMKLRSEVQGALARKLKKKVLEELIDERLMLQEAKKQNLVVSKADVDKRLTLLAKRNKDKATGRPLSLKQFLTNLERSGISERTFRARMKASLAFQQVIYRKYGRVVQNRGTDREIDIILASSGDVKKNTEFNVQRIKLAVGKDANQQTIAKRLLDAEVLRSKFTSCKNTEKLVKGISGGSVQSLGRRTPKQLPKAARAIFLQAKSGEMTPPNITNEGIILYAICSRRNVAGDDKARAQVKNKLRQQEFQLLRRRYLRDLRQDAYIDYKSS
ncbi:MAG: SurA N-terminal domain-containing protein [Methyloligellaceae bacterium]